MALLIVAAPGLAAPFAVQVGESRIALDAPPGFADTTFTGSPRLQELAESLTSASNRVLLFAISDLDLRKFALGDRPEFRRYMLAVTPKALEREWMSRPSFATLANESMRELGEPMPAETSLADYLAAQPQGRPTMLAELRREPEIVSVLVGARLNDEYLLSTMTLMLVRGKALSFSAYARYESQADLGWIRSVTARWIDDLQRLNAR